MPFDGNGSQARSDNRRYRADLMPAVSDGYAIAFLQGWNASQIQVFFLARINRNRMHQSERAIMLFKNADGFVKLLQRAHACGHESVLFLGRDMIHKRMIRNHRRRDFAMFQIELAKEVLALNVPR